MSMRYLATSFTAWLAVSGPADAIEQCTGGDRAARGVTCLVDGDTGWEAGVKWRLKDIDTPEYAPHAECAAEPIMAEQATQRMLELMSGGYSVVWLGEKGGLERDLVKIRLADAQDAGRVLLEEGLAVEWPHAPGVWCGKD